MYLWSASNINIIFFNFHTITIQLYQNFQDRKISTPRYHLISYIDKNKNPAEKKLASVKSNANKVAFKVRANFGTNLLSPASGFERQTCVSFHRQPSLSFPFASTKTRHNPVCRTCQPKQFGGVDEFEYTMKTSVKGAGKVFVDATGKVFLESRLCPGLYQKG